MRMEYNNRDQITRTIDALDGNTVFTYDDAGRILSVTNPAGVVIERNRYDGAGNLIERTDALNRSETFEYDRLNRLIRATDRKGQSTRWEYNSAGELVQTTWPDGVAEQREYDLLGRLREVREPSGTITYTYDSQDRVTDVTHTTAAGRVDIQYAYNRFDKPLLRRVFHNGTVIESSKYSWDTLDRLAGHRVSVPAFAGMPDQITLYSYNNANQLARRTLPNGVQQHFAYDKSGRVSQIKYVRTDGGVIEQIDYTYDAVGRRTGKALLNTSGQDETPLQAEYDAANRMTKVTLYPAPYQEGRIFAV